MTLIRIIFFFIIFYYLFKLIGRYILPWLIKKFFNRMTQQQSNVYQRTKQEYKKKEGEVTVHYNTDKNKKRRSDNEGDYVDYEEIK
ncbi:MAG: DUF4834 family protein [Bacteroidales bacterium]|nr:DUF4834 family protein [Bacteroidales bacterium]